MTLRERIAYLICPSLEAEINVLRSANTKIVLENARLMDELEAEDRLFYESFPLRRKL